MAKAKPKRQLTNIRPREVSLVDEAANLRDFITVKRKKGGESMGKKNSEILKDQNPEVTVLKVSAELKDAAEIQAQAALEKMMSVVDAIKKLEVGGEGEEAGDLPNEILQDSKGAATLLIKFISHYNQINKDAETSEDDVDVVATVDKTLEEIEKAGKKMSGIRLQKLDAALQTLQALKNELVGGEAAKKDSDGKGDSEANTTKSTNNEPEEVPMDDKVKQNASEQVEEVKVERAPEEAYAVANADVIKSREAMRDAEGKGDEEAVKVAKESLEKAEGVFKVAKEAKEKAEKDAEVAKAEEVKKEAEVALKKAKGEPVEEPKADKSDAILKAIGGLKETVEKQAEEIEKMKSTAAAPAADTDDDNNDADVNKNKDDVWGGLFK